MGMSKLPSANFTFILLIVLSATVMFYNSPHNDVSILCVAQIIYFLAKYFATNCCKHQKLTYQLENKKHIFLNFLSGTYSYDNEQFCPKWLFKY